jgi:DNA-binding NarL/FixJ family response regulator
MKNILIVDDTPELKVEMLIKIVEMAKVQFTYEIVKSSNAARRYLADKENKVDAIIMDLGLPLFDGEFVNDLLEGMHLIYELERFKIKCPVIINSTTEIPDYNEKKADWEEIGLEIYKTDFILRMKDWFIEFLKD